jgi:RNA polymerase sigma factor (sigma-70 family)
MAGEPRFTHELLSALEPTCRPLIERCKQGDSSALNDLIVLIYPIVRDHIHKELGRALRKRVDTEDIAQTAIRQVLKKGPPRFESIRGFLAFWLVVAETKIVQAARDNRRQKRDMNREVSIPDTSSRGVGLQAPMESPLVNLLVQEDLLLLSRALFRLGEEDRLLVIERDLEERSFAELARIHDKSEPAIRKAHSRAKARLLAYLATLEPTSE